VTAAAVAASYLVEVDSPLSLFLLGLLVRTEVDGMTTAAQALLAVLPRLPLFAFPDHDLIELRSQFSFDFLLQAVLLVDPSLYF